MADGVRSVMYFLLKNQKHSTQKVLYKCEKKTNARTHSTQRRKSKNKSGASACCCLACRLLLLSFSFLSVLSAAGSCFFVFFEVVSSSSFSFLRVVFRRSGLAARPSLSFRSPFLRFLRFLPCFPLLLKRLPCRMPRRAPRRPRTHVLTHHCRCRVSFPLFLKKFWFARSRASTYYRGVRAVVASTSLRCRHRKRFW